MREIIWQLFQKSNTVLLQQLLRKCIKKEIGRFYRFLLLAAFFKVETFRKPAAVFETFITLKKLQLEGVLFAVTNFSSCFE